MVKTHRRPASRLSVAFSLACVCCSAQRPLGGNTTPPRTPSAEAVDAPAASAAPLQSDVPAPSRPTQPAQPATPSPAEPAQQGANPDTTATAVAPASVSPPHARTAATDDGHWRAFDGTRDATSSERWAHFWRTALHPHPKSKFVVVDVVAIDLRQLKLNWVVGAGDVGAERLAPFMTPGLIATADAPGAVAVFNGGFLARHGWWGQLSHGQALVPPKANGCGVALFADGRVRLGLYADFADDSQLVTYRQTPPCLVNAGKLHENLERGHDRAWAGKNDALATRRRSALGISRDGHTLYYLLGTETAPLDLARAMTALGVHTGLQLDINWNWTRFFRVGGDARGRTVQDGLVDTMVHDRGEYFTRPSQRDFFVLGWR
jgi:hypothetical protein